MAAPAGFYAAATMTGPAFDAFALTPSDTNNFVAQSLPPTMRALYVGVTGDLTVVTFGGNTITFKAVPVGMLIPLVVTQIKATNTTATNIIGLA